MARESGFRLWAERADRLSAPGTRHRVLADLAMSMIPLMAGDAGAAWILRRRALDLSRQLDDPDSFVMVANLIFGHSWAPQHEQERLELAREVGEKYVQLPGGPGRDEPNLIGQVNLLFLSNAYLQMGERAHAENIWGELRERAARTQDANLLLSALNAEGTAATLDGRLEEALAVGETLRSRGEEWGIPDVGRTGRLVATIYPLL
jgi:hypothetical protein